jgi:hypothetical protein
MIRPLLIAGLLFFGTASALSAQAATDSSTSGQQGNSNPQPAAQAQTRTPDPSSPENRKKQKKVWTNEDVGSSKDGVSVVGDHQTVSTASPCSSCSKPSAYDKVLQLYRKKLEPLRSDLAEIDRKIQMAKEAKGNASEDTAAWIRVYDGKRKDVLVKMERIEDEARRAGVLPGDLRD